MTEIHPRYYSGGMISDFTLLSEKISQLAEMVQSLRKENSVLRHDLSALAAENAELLHRIEEAHQRVTALLDRIPVRDDDEDDEEETE